MKIIIKSIFLLTLSLALFSCSSDDDTNNDGDDTVLMNDDDTATDDDTNGADDMSNEDDTNTDGDMNNDDNTNTGDEMNNDDDMNGDDEMNNENEVNLQDGWTPSIIGLTSVACISEDLGLSSDDCSCLIQVVAENYTLEESMSEDFPNEEQTLVLTQAAITNCGDSMSNNNDDGIQEGWTSENISEVTQECTTLNQDSSMAECSCLTQVLAENITFEEFTSEEDFSLTQIITISSELVENCGEDVLLLDF